MVSKSAGMYPTRAIIGGAGRVLLIFGPIAFFFWFALSGVPDLWDLLIALLQPE